MNCQKKAKHVIIFGVPISDLIKLTNKSGPISVEDIEGAGYEAIQHAKEGDVFLFSPVTAYLQVLNEFERGELYTNAVKSLQKKENH